MEKVYTIRTKICNHYGTGNFLQRRVTSLAIEMKLDVWLIRVFLMSFDERLSALSLSSGRRKAETSPMTSAIQSAIFTHFSLTHPPRRDCRRTKSDTGRIERRHWYQTELVFLLTTIPATSRANAATAPFIPLSRRSIRIR